MRFSKVAVFTSLVIGFYSASALAVIDLPKDQAQTDGWSCGIYAAATVLQYYKVPVTYSELKSAAPELKIYDYLPDAMKNGFIGQITKNIPVGPPPARLALFMTEQLNELKNAQTPSKLLGFKEVHASGIAPILIQLNKNVPVIAMIKNGEFFGFPTLHMITLTGYDLKTKLFTYNDSDRETRIISFKEFEAQWGFPETVYQDSGAVGKMIVIPEFSNEASSSSSSSSSSSKNNEQKADELLNFSM